MNIKHLEVKRAYYADPENVVVQYDDRHTGKWEACVGEPHWCEQHVYRIKPKTIRIGEIDVPEPVRVALQNGQKYFYICAHASDCVLVAEWLSDRVDLRLLSRGLIHLTREAAELHAKALILVGGGTTDGID